MGTAATAAVAGAWTMIGAAGVSGAVTAWTGTGMLVAGGATGGVESARAVIAAGRCTRADCWIEAIPSAGIDLAAATAPTFKPGFEWDCWPDGPESRPVPVGATGAARSTARDPRVRGDAGDASAWATESAAVWESVVSAGAAQADPAPPATTAAPIPSATARPPTRPTWADARITLNLPTAPQGLCLREPD